MVVLSCAYSAYPMHAVSLRAHRGFSPERSTSPVSVSLTHHHRHHHHDHLFVPEHFGGSTGYGHEDAGGREALDQAFAEIVGAESAIVRSQFFSGTHDIKCALFAFLDEPSHHKAIEPVIESQSKTRLQLQPQLQLRRPAEVVEDNSHAQTQHLWWLDSWVVCYVN